MDLFEIDNDLDNEKSEESNSFKFRYSSYEDRLLMSEWKIKRLEILKRDSYICTKCGSHKDLQVHHTYYRNDFPDPWEYENESLVTLCSKCHNLLHKTMDIPITDGPIEEIEYHLRFALSESFNTRKEFCMNSQISILK